MKKSNMVAWVSGAVAIVAVALGVLFFLGVVGPKQSNTNTADRKLVLDGAPILSIQSSDFAGEKNFEIQREWLDSIEEATNGRVRFELLSNGAGVDFDETLDAMRLGLLDGQITAIGYFSFKDPAFGLIGNTVGAWSDPQQFFRYMYEGGGNQLMEKLYEPYGVQFIGAYTSGLEAFVSKVPLNGVSDLKGIKLRSPGGMVSQVFKAVGADPISLTGSQIPTALEKDTIQAADYSVFSTNQSAGLNDIAPNPVYPGFHSMPALNVSLSKKKWDALPPDVQNAIKGSVRKFGDTMLAKLKAADDEALKKAKANPNITIHDWSAEERKKFRTIAQEQWKIASEKSANSKLVYDSVTTFLKSNNLL